MGEAKVAKVVQKACEYILVLLRGSRGPSTVTLIALVYVATCGGFVLTVIVRVKLLPEDECLRMSFRCFMGIW
jgi:hypothetical protein